MALALRLLKSAPRLAEQGLAARFNQEQMLAFYLVPFRFWQLILGAMLFMMQTESYAAWMAHKCCCGGSRGTTTLEPQASQAIESSVASEPQKISLEDSDAAKTDDGAQQNATVPEEPGRCWRIVCVCICEAFIQRW